MALNDVTMAVRNVLYRLSLPKRSLQFQFDGEDEQRFYLVPTYLMDEVNQALDNLNKEADRG